MNRYLIAGNWKMNCTTKEAALLCEGIISDIKNIPAAVEIAICPPFTSLSLVKEKCGNNKISLGGQDCHEKSNGAFTGNISAAMLKDIGCDYVILGHSERRQYHHETDTLVQQKAIAAMAANVVPIICIGETLAEREAGKTLNVISRQLASSLPVAATTAIVIAYEPVWAIGTGKVATLEQIAEVHDFIRAQLPNAFKQSLLLYGGSVKPDNAASILALENVNGALVGGASLQAQDFLAIAGAAFPAAQSAAE